MNKFDNYVYMTICEITLKLVKETHYASYGSYCKSIADCLRDGQIPKSRQYHLGLISSKLSLIYALSFKESGKYISNYFLDGKYLTLERPIRLFKEYFPDIQEIC